MLVQASIYEEVLDALKAVVGSYVVGMPLDPATMMGPLVSDVSLDRVLGFIDRARSSGAGRLLWGGARLGGELARGFFVEPTVFCDVDNRSELATEEIFGPVLAVTPFTTEAEGIRLANDTTFGLAAFVHTRDVERAHRVARSLDAGYVSVNGFAGLTPAAPFGGVKASGFGRQGGRAGLDEFLRPRNVFVAFNDVVVA
jgi:aldehyde dehydrogenase (NAD+)